MLNNMLESVKGQVQVMKFALFLTWHLWIGKLPLLELVLLHWHCCTTRSAR